MKRPQGFSRLTSEIHHPLKKRQTVHCLCSHHPQISFSLQDPEDRPFSKEGQDGDHKDEKGFLHRMRWTHWCPTGVLRLTAVPDGGVVALGRASGALEFWETRHATCLKRVAGRRDWTWTGLEWMTHEDRFYLVGCTLEGMLIEWNLESGGMNMEEAVDGGGIWNMAVGRKHNWIAVGCEDGTVRVYHPRFGNGFELYGLLPCASTRALCVNWSPNEAQLAAGYADGSVRLFALLAAPTSNLHLGHETLRLTVTARSPPAVWSVLHLGGEIVVGDGEGNVCWWDAHHGNRLSRFQRHEGDITCLRHLIQNDVAYVVSAGVDGGVVIYRCQSSGWRCLHIRRPHAHDIHSLIVFENDHQTMMMTASADGTVFSVACPKDDDIVRAFLKKRLRILDPLPEMPSFQLKGRLLTAVTGQAVEIYRFPDDPAVEVKRRDVGEKLPASMPELLVKCDASGKRHITCAAVASDCRLLTVSTEVMTKLFVVDGIANVQSIGIRSLAARRPLPPACGATFTCDASWLFLVDFENTLWATPLQTSKTKPKPRSLGTIQTPTHAFLRLHPCGLRCFSGDTRLTYHVYDCVYVYTISDNDPNKAVRLLHVFHMSLPITALCVEDNDVITVDIRNTIRRCNAEEGTFETLKIQGPSTASRDGPCHAISCSPSGLLLSLPSKTAHVKCRHWKTAEMKILHSERNMRTLFAGFMETRSALLVEADWQQVLSSRPAPVYRHRYGT